MRVLIVEDEMVAYNNLKKIVSEIDTSIEVVGNTESISRTVKWLQDYSYGLDLIFMDIHLSDGSAFKIFELIKVETPIVFTTAYDEYAINAFKVNSIDYLLKPIEVADVAHAIGQFRKRTGQDLKPYLSMLPHLIPKENYPEKILIPEKDKLIPIAVNKISCFYNTTEITTIVHLKDGSSYPYKKTLDYIINSLNPNQYFRANKQFIISKDSVKNITVWFDSRLLITLDIDIPERLYISKNKAAEFKQWLIR